MAVTLVLLLQLGRRSHTAEPQHSSGHSCYFGGGSLAQIARDLNVMHGGPILPVLQSFPTIKA